MSDILKPIEDDLDKKQFISTEDAMKIAATEYALDLPYLNPFELKWFFSYRTGCDYVLTDFSIDSHHFKLDINTGDASCRMCLSQIHCMMQDRFDVINMPELHIWTIKHKSHWQY